MFVTSHVFFFILLDWKAIVDLMQSTIAELMGCIITAFISVVSKRDSFEFVQRNRKEEVNYWRNDSTLIATFTIETSNEKKIKEHFVMFVLRLSSFRLHLQLLPTTLFFFSFVIFPFPTAF